MPEYLIKTNDGVTLTFAPSADFAGLTALVIRDSNALLGTGYFADGSVTIEPYTPPVVIPPPNPVPIVPKAYRLKIARNLRVDDDLQSGLVFTVPSGGIVRVLTNDKPVADGLVWRRVEYSVGTPAIGLIVYTGWLAVCDVNDADGVGSWLEVLESAG